MANIQSLDPTASPLDYYGWELRRQREAHGLKQGQLGDIIFCTGSLVGQIETTRKVPTRDFSERVDAALGTDGLFSRLIGLVLRSQLPTWFQPYAEMEAKAAYISTYQAQLVYGLLQTEEYARAVLATGMPDDLEGLLAARMERQRILERERPPLAWVVLDEAVCCTGRSVGIRSCGGNWPGCWSSPVTAGCRCRCCRTRRGPMPASPVHSPPCASTTTRTSSTRKTSSPVT
ncbi:transcriptional regulator with XRE-family HTH domain [Streptomyces ambofaciens]